jgi:transposase
MVVLFIASALASRPAEALPGWAQRAMTAVQARWAGFKAGFAQRRAMRARAQSQLDLLKLGKPELKELKQRGVSYDRSRGGQFKFGKGAEKHWIEVGDNVLLSRDGKYRYHPARSVNGGELPAFMEKVASPEIGTSRGGSAEARPQTLESAVDKISTAQTSTESRSRAPRVPRLERELQASRLLASGVRTSAEAATKLGISRRHAQRVLGSVASYDPAKKVWVSRPLPPTQRERQVVALLDKGINRSALVAAELGISQQHAAKLLGRVASYDRKTRVWTPKQAAPAEPVKPAEPDKPAAEPPAPAPGHERLLQAITGVLKASSTPLGGKKIVGALKARGIEVSEKAVQRALRELKATQQKGPVSGWVLPADQLANP